MPQRGCTAPLNRLSLEQCAEYYQGLGVAGTVEEIAQELSQCALEGYRTWVPEKPHAGSSCGCCRKITSTLRWPPPPTGRVCWLPCAAWGCCPLVEEFATCTEVGKSKEHLDVHLRCARKLWRGPRRERGL